MTVLGYVESELSKIYTESSNEARLCDIYVTVPVITIISY
jgi:hypothetical protein